jgi:hypothetical protein
MVASDFSIDVCDFASLPYLDNDDIINSSLFTDLITVYMHKGKGNPVTGPGGPKG